MDSYDGALPELPASGLSEKRIKELAMQKINAGKRPKIKKLRVLLVAAAVIAALSATVLAVSLPMKVNDRNVVAAVNGELEYFRDAGILANPVVVSDDAEIAFYGDGAASALSRWFSFIGDEDPVYTVSSVSGEYSCLATIDAVTGKLISLSVCNMDCHGMTPLSLLEGNDRNYIDKRTGEPLAFYDDYYKVLGADITIDGMFDVLCDYWGFKSYELGGEYVGVNALAFASDNYFDNPIISARFTDSDGNSDERYINFCPTASGSYVIIGVNHALG